MRVFLVACLAAVFLAVGAFYGLASVQKPAGSYYTTEGARISPAWNWRQMVSRPKAAPQTVAMSMPQGNATVGECDVQSAWNWILADFLSTPTADPTCETSH